MASGPNMAPSAGYAIQGQAMSAQTAGPPRGNALVYVVIGVLMAAIGVLAYLVMTK
jgi:hypothetical protein